MWAAMRGIDGDVFVRGCDLVGLVWASMGEWLGVDGMYSGSRNMVGLCCSVRGWDLVQV